MGAQEVTPQEAPGLHAMIERLCIQADLPKPKLAVADTDLPNAFATRPLARRAPPCAPPPGSWSCSRPRELEGVMAHELTHVKQPRRAGHDARQLLRHARRLHRAVRLLLRRRRATTTTTRASWSSSSSRSSSTSSRSSSCMALSRYREFAADRGAAIDHRPPERAGLGAVKISERHAADPAAGPARGRAS